jgi:hypothetical protein
MHRGIPVTNKFLDQKWNRIQHQKLQDRIRDVKGAVSASTPGSPSGTTGMSAFRVIINRAKRDQI